jgi:hypothetical protein
MQATEKWPEYYTPLGLWFEGCSGRGRKEIHVKKVPETHRSRDRKFERREGEACCHTDVP